ncbi:MULTISPECIES: DUF2971 domain-containing protein [Pseudomonas]|uniref:DUF2971 domain-containing protein n=1 Tax=Pseudomonas TaxID=286 RepID=UPI001115A313|nr:MULTISPECIES: DUF2971 domain-containing protein [Pseudomonas]QXH92849.1 DUF2971 domain-containing protein [Pseudomonas zarinae]
MAAIDFGEVTEIASLKKLCLRESSVPAHHEYRSEWVAAGYKSDMGSAIASRPPKERSLRRVYHLTSAEYAVSNIALGRLKVSRFSDLNDPFELIGLNFREKMARNIVRDFKDAYDAHTGLLCFSGDWAEPVLWSHYAAKHRGICLGFDVPSEYLQKIQYEDERILAELGNNPELANIDPALQDALLRTKSSGWKYEDEYRRFVHLTDAFKEERLYFLPFGPGLELTEVVLGPLCTHSLKSVRELVTSRYPTAITYKSRLAYKTYKVVPDELTIP